MTMQPQPDRLRHKRAQAIFTAIEQGEKLARDGSIDDAVDFFQQARELNPNLTLDPQLKAQKLAAQALLERSKDFAKKGNIQEALAGYAKVQRLDPALDISVLFWNSLCWFGSLWGYAAEVMDACKKAVALDPENGNIRDSRGLARALTGDIEGAKAR
jgi:tetratricopeptide (TPR) repeat protein